MAEVRGFRGMRYNPNVIQNFDDVVTPPFDVISEADRATLAAKSPHNYVHFILPEPAGDLDKYQAGAQLLEKWTADGIVQRDDEPSFYLLEQRFSGLDGKARVRRGFFGVIHLPEDGDGTVLGHERTFEAKFQDRLKLTTAAKANPGAVFLLYDDPNRKLAGFLGQMDSRDPDTTAHTIDNVDVRLWRVPDDPAVHAFFADRTLYIADGHHRFRTACAYRDQMRADGAPDGGPHEFALMGFVAGDDPGFLICPAHRLVNPPAGFDLAAFIAKLEDRFNVTTTDEDIAAKVENSDGCCFGIVSTAGDRYFAELKPDTDRTALLGDDHGEAWQALDVSVLHRAILENTMGLDENAMLIYEHDSTKALARVASGEAGLGFLLKGVTPHQLFACADSGEYMPQKSTYIFPKLPSGAVFHRLD
jgi:uncharacterized protein (DUF1015 family)